MDLLKEELQKKRRSVDQGFAGKKFVKRSDLHNKQLQQLRDEERRELQAKSLRTTGAAAPATPSTAAATASAAASTASTAASPSEERRIDDLVLPRPEVIRRLRLLKQPVTLFGEDDDARLDRFKLTLKAGVFEVDSDMTEGQTNDFLRDIHELRKRQKTGILHGRSKGKDKDGMEDGDGGGGGDGDLSGDGGSSGVDADKDLTRMKADFEGLCEEDRILVFFKRLLNEWNQELEEMPDTEKRTAKGKSMVATYKQCARYLTPLFKFCRKKVLPLCANFFFFFLVSYLSWLMK